jgi:hypothetical protein
MKKRILPSICVVISTLITGNLRADQPAVIKIDLDKKIAAVDPNIYGGFLEPIRTVVYGTIYDPKSPLADTNGFRTDFIQLIKELHIPVVRWPGGNYVSGYNWEDGIGPKDQRPVRLDLAWNQIDRNQMGTDEYAKLCSLIGADNFVCINAGLGRWTKRGIGSNTAIIPMEPGIQTSGESTAMNNPSTSNTGRSATKLTVPGNSARKMPRTTASSRWKPPKPCAWWTGM